ncbi:MAG: hypothetical protein A2637_04795 [Candidatus Muproteobacteria bacterium RIFCSPHIGHO2_01_FULL_65_16]|uniref:FHA domain-containing protein n=2 Tax=Candidatus Muproteobacteria TaxID=1817795 RepID=A0A1F6TQ85_9PROT|nr:MAG: hypothetical protein A2637_04795 [Candidatus Muproteobacteria bacterium RIFCSPHIGHO2_01_FULL_65_16]OGI50560.1 MAG: hypothetical protein A3B81_02755 [Candidatus Muproteobacteria bacterium RIFCSPHIGHO2_02_FULL_65_16]
MAKLVIKFGNEVIDHVELRQGDMKVGRKPGCDIHIDNLAISGEHANIFTIGEDSFIQDLGSTNGTFVNGKKISKHHLREGDSISIGKHSLVYLGESAAPGAGETQDDFTKTVIITSPGLREPVKPPAAPAGAKPAGGQQGAIMVLNGANSGKRIELAKTVTSLGRTGKSAGKITRSADGYTLTGNDTDEVPKLNGRPVPNNGARLKNGDIIEVAGTRLQFLLR